MCILNIYLRYIIYILHTSLLKRNPGVQTTMKHKMVISPCAHIWMMWLELSVQHSIVCIRKSWADWQPIGLLILLPKAVILQYCVQATPGGWDKCTPGSGGVSMNSWTHHEPPNGGSCTSCVTLVVALVGAMVLCVYHTVCKCDPEGSHGNPPHCWKQIGRVASRGLQWGLAALQKRDREMWRGQGLVV